MKLCDLHTHVLPGVDDGAPNLEYAMQMLRNAEASDVAVLALTPHCSDRYENFLDQDLQNRFLQLQEAAREIPVQLLLGAEVRVNEQLLQHLAAGRLPTLNGSRYLLTEFPTDTPAEVFPQVLQGILCQGYIPLVAHPERYLAVVGVPNLVEDWLDMGCHVQLTGASLTGEYGRAIQSTAMRLLQQDLVACIASDAHGTSRRSNFLLDAYDHLSVRYCRQYADCLLYENPMRICMNESIG